MHLKKRNGRGPRVFCFYVNNFDLMGTKFKCVKECIEKRESNP